MLTIENLTKRFPGSRGSGSGGQPVVAVNDVSFEVEEGELFTMLGPSGCGKTTTLRSVAGLERPNAGEISVDGRVLFSSTERVNVAPADRRLGMVFQSYAIWPHMNVYDNVVFPLTVLPRGRRPSRKQLVEKVEKVLEVVQLGDLPGRQATDLSGGQQQRLALARALIMEPRLLLLDEPLSNLDAKLREEMRFELKRLQRELGITSIYVTHDQLEALALSNRIAVMRDGVIAQVGRPRDIYERPNARFVADFIGSSNFFEGVVQGQEGDGTFRVSTSEGELLVTSSANVPVGNNVTVAIRPEHVEIEAIGEAGAPGPGVWQGRVHNRAFLGESVDHLVSVGKVTVHNRSHSVVSIEPETQVTLRFPAEWCKLITDD